MKPTVLGKILRTVAVIMVGLTAAMNTLGGVGTTCAAFFTKKYPPMWALLDYQWLYQTFVVVTTLIGLAGAWTTFKLIRGGKTAYRNAVIVLVIGVVVNTIHVIASISLRGKATPGDVVLGLNVITLLFMLFLKLPRFRDQVPFEEEAGKSERSAAAGLTAIVAGVLILTSRWWAGPTHTFQGDNWVDLLIAPLYLGGGVLLMAGFAKLLRLAMELWQQQTQVIDRKVT